MKYATFLESKIIKHESTGPKIDRDVMPDFLFGFQADVTWWSVRKGRCALWLDTGLGKTPCSLVWSDCMLKYTDTEIVLIVAPLSVARQTAYEEAPKFGFDINLTRDGSLKPGINITNYEMISKFDPAKIGAIVLDESSILKHESSKTRKKLTDMFASTPYRLCCTATPCPNDIAELGFHSEFLGVLRDNEVKSTFFVHDDQGFRLRGHSADRFYKWLASWGMAIKKPSDLGYDDDGFILPELNVYTHFVDTDYLPEGQLAFTGLKGIRHRSQIRKATVEDRSEYAASLVNSSDEQWIVWTGYNPESTLMTKLIPDAVEVTGSHPPDYKADTFTDFRKGNIRVLVTKVSIAGKGMNFQNSHNQVFVGLSDSFEDYYQAIRRQYRYLQEHDVNVYVVLSELEDAIWSNVRGKEREAELMTKELIRNVAEFEKAELGKVETSQFEYEKATEEGKDWIAMLGDSVERMKELDDSSIHLAVFSPPFRDLFTYSPTERDLGNCQTGKQFFAHFGYIVDELMRITIPGRVCAVHVADIPAQLVKDGYIGMTDFSGDVVRFFQERGWIYDGRIPIDKNQQAQSIRTHAKALTKSQWEKDRSWLRPALPDYILKFRKPGENPTPVYGDMLFDTWIEWANPTWPCEKDRCGDWGAFATWYGIRESDTLQGWRTIKGAHSNNGGNDDKHICPLQLPTIRRCIRLWTNRGEIVLDMFGGIGSTGVEAIRLKRKAIICELKRVWWEEAVRQLQAAEAESQDMFAWAGLEVE